MSKLLFIDKNKDVFMTEYVAGKDSVGEITVCISEERKTIYFMAFQVEEEYQSQGFGKKLFELAIQSAKEAYPTYSFILDSMPDFRGKDHIKVLKRLTKFYLNTFKTVFKEIKLIPNSKIKENLYEYRVIGSI